MATHRTSYRWLAAAALVLPLAGCGKQESTSARLQDDTTAVVEALNAGNVDAASRALTVLDSDTAAAGRLGQLSDARVTAMHAGVTRLRADLVLLRSPVVPNVVPTTPSSSPTHHGDKKKGHDGND